MKTKEQQDTIDELSSAVKEFLKVQSCAKKLQGNIAKIHTQVKSQTFKVTVPKIGPQIVKPFTPEENSEESQTTMGIQSPMSALEEQRMRLIMSGAPGREIYNNLQSIIELTTKELHQHKERRPKLPVSPLKFQELEKSIISRLEGEEVPCKHLAFMATPVKRSKATTMNDQSSEDSMDFDVTSESESEQEDSEAESNSSKQSFKYWVRSLDLDTSVSPQDEDSEDSKQDTSGSCNEDDSYNDEPEHPHHQIHRKGSKKRKFVFPKPSDKSRSAACARIKEALDQVPYSVHLNSRGDRDTATLYVGNIDYKASEEDLSKAIDKIFQRIRVEKVTIPRVNGRSMYGFIEISWARRAPVKASDLCIMNSSGMVKVNGRPIYFRESCGKDDSA